MNNKQLRLSTAVVLASSVALTVMPSQPVYAATKADTATITTNNTKVPTYKDVPVKANYFDAVEEMTKRGLITGYADKTFKPNAKITRGQIAKILTRMIELKTTKKIKFTDIPTTHSFYEVANAVVAAGIMSTDSKGRFNTKEFLTREEYAYVLAKAFELEAISTTLPFKDFNAQYKSAIQAVYDNGVMRGNTSKTFNGKGNISRSQVALTLYKAIQLQEAISNPPEDQEETEPDIETKTFMIYEINGTKVLTDEDEKITIPQNMRSLIRDYNEDVLIDAEITATFEKGKWVDTHSITLYSYESGPLYSTLEGFNGTYPISIISNGTNVRLTNMTVNVVMAGDMADDQLTLENVTVKNKVAVLEGSSYDFRLTLVDSNVPYVQVNQDAVHISSTKTIPQLFLEAGVYDSYVDSSVTRLQVVREGAVTLHGVGTIDYVILPMDAEVFINSQGTIKDLRIDNPDAWIQIGTEAKIKKITIPTGASFEDMLSYDGHIQDNVEKIVHPNSSANILAQLIEKPTKEEREYENTLKNVIKGYGSSISGKRMTIITDFNEIPKSLAEVTFNQVISLAGMIPSVKYIPLVVRRGGIEVFNDEVAVEDLIEGISFEDLTGESFTFEDFKSNDRLMYHFDFDTTQELKLRSKLYVNEEDRLTTEQTINAGANASFTSEVQKAFNAYTVSGSGKTITTSIRLNAVNALIKEAPVKQHIKLLDAPTDTNLKMTVKRDGEQLFSGLVPVSTLRNGVNLSDISDSLIESIGTLKASGESRYTIEFDTEKELNFEMKLMMHNSQRGATQAVKINSGATQNFNNKVISAFKAYGVASVGNVATANIELNAVDELVRTANVDQNIKLLSSINASTVEVSIKKDGVELFKGPVSTSSLNKGLNISSLNASLKQTLSSLKANGTTSFTIEFKTNEVLKFEQKLLINNEQRGTTQTFMTDGGAQQIAAITPKYKHTAATTDGFTVELGDVSNVPSYIEATPVDVNLKLSQATLLPKTVQLKLTYGTESKTITVQHSDLTSNGINILANLTKKLTLKDLVAGASLKVEVLTPLDGSFTSTVLVNNRPQGIVSTANANVTPIRKLAVASSTPVMGTMTTAPKSGVRDFKLAAGDNQLVVDTTYKSFTDADASRYLDARLTLTHNLPSSTYYTIGVSYNGQPVPGLDLKKVSTDDLKEGLYLSKLLGTKPILAAKQNHPTSDKWAFVIHDLKGVQMPVKVEVVTLSTNDTAVVTTADVVVIAGAEVIVNTGALSTFVQPLYTSSMLASKAISLVSANTVARKEGTAIVVSYTGNEAAHTVNY